ncbi:MAG TPA: PAS domain-containing protein [Rhizomicrobium sp.]|jgi:hypothetical protein
MQSAQPLASELSPGAPDLHPELESLLAYWFVKRAARTMPARSEMPPGEWERWHRNLALFGVIQYGALRVYECRMASPALAARLGGDVTGLSLDEMDADVRTSLRVNFESAWEKRAPVLGRTRMMVGAEAVTYSDLILPLSDNGRSADLILLGSYPVV